MMKYYLNLKNKIIYITQSFLDEGDFNYWDLYIRDLLCIYVAKSSSSSLSNKGFFLIVLIIFNK